MNKVKATKMIRQHGNSLTVNVTKECDMIGVGRGDVVEVTIEKVVDEEEPLTEDQIRDLMCDTRYASH